MPSKEITKHQVLAGLKGRITCTNRSPLLPPPQKATVVAVLTKPITARGRIGEKAAKIRLLIHIFSTNV